MQLIIMLRVFFPKQKPIFPRSKERAAKPFTDGYVCSLIFFNNKQVMLHKHLFSSLLLLLFIGNSSFAPNLHETSQVLETCEVFGSSAACIKVKPKGEFDFQVVHKEPVIKNLRMIGKVGKCGIESGSSTERLHGSIIRALRFQNITRKVEEKYDLPKNLILAMIMQETHGIDVLPNCLDDGGIGICHMQGSTAHDFGLSTYRGFKDLRNKRHGEMLRNLIIQKKYDRKQLIEHDDRFHPILNIDAAGRMLHCYKNNKKIKGLTSTQTAIRYYAGSRNYRHYWRNVQYYMNKLNDPAVIKGAEKAFNRINTKLTIDGEKGTFQAYINAHQKQNFNYGLGNYK